MSYQLICISIGLRIGQFSDQLIGMTNGPRSVQFALVLQVLFPFAGVTAEVDITSFAARRRGRPFFPGFLYAVVRAANAIPQLRRCIREDGSVVEYDWCLPSYTAMKPDGVYVYCTVEGDLPYEAFVALGQRRQREVCHRLCHKRKFCNSDCKQKE